MAKGRQEKPGGTKKSAEADPESTAGTLSQSLELAYQYILQSGDAILAFDPEKEPARLDEAMRLLEKIGMLYIDYQLLIAAKRGLIRNALQTMSSARYATHEPQNSPQPPLKK